MRGDADFLDTEARAARITTLTLEAGATELLQAMALYDRERPGAR